MISGKIKSLCYLLMYHWRYKLCFGAISRKTRLLSPLQINGAKRIFIERGVIIEKKTWLATRKINTEIDPVLKIEQGARIGNFNHLFCTGKITICKNVLTADKVYISDNLHSYENINTPIWQQPIKQLNPVIIGEGAWLGENVCVIGASVGRGSVVGANSVVTKDIPEFCVAVGAPARVIKKYNPQTQTWEKIK